MFEAIDADGSGTITVDELREGLRKKGASLALQEVCSLEGMLVAIKMHHSALIFETHVGAHAQTHSGIVCLQATPVSFAFAGRKAGG